MLPQRDGVIVGTVHSAHYSDRKRPKYYGATPAGFQLFINLLQTKIECWIVLLYSLPFFTNFLLSGQFYSFTVYMVCANSIVNPFVYAIQYHEFQQRIRELFKGKPDQLNNFASVSTGSTSLQTNNGCETENNRQK